ncbi:hypothetical protein DFH09DRAFT_1320177 [Mycena vulgaris]|nr:hypothetical protein DFH09DRAFT_1320177 [Mycena vulgaris]
MLPNCSPSLPPCPSDDDTDVPDRVANPSSPPPRPSNTLKKTAQGQTPPLTHTRQAHRRSSEGPNAERTRELGPCARGLGSFRRRTSVRPCTVHRALWMRAATRDEGRFLAFPLFSFHSCLPCLGAPPQRRRPQCRRRTVRHALWMRVAARDETKYTSRTVETSVDAADQLPHILRLLFPLRPTLPPPLDQTYTFFSAVVSAPPSSLSQNSVQPSTYAFQQDFPLRVVLPFASAELHAVYFLCPMPLSTSPPRTPR